MGKPRISHVVWATMVTAAIAVVAMLYMHACGAGGGGGDGGSSATPPSAPTDLVAEMGDGELTLTWTASSGATGHNLYWSTNPGVTVASGKKIAGVSSPYVHTGLANGTTYYYAVTAESAGGESQPSVQASAAPVFTVTVPDQYASIAAGIAAVPAGGRVLLKAGTYTGDVSVTKGLILDGSKQAATVTGQITVGAADVLVRNLKVTNPKGGYGITVLGVSRVTITHSDIHDIGNDSAHTGTAQGIYISASGVTVPLDGIKITGNSIAGIGNSSSGSNKGIFVGDSLANVTHTNLTITGNTISGIAARDDAVYAQGGRGAYGILVNWGVGPSKNGTVPGAVIANNAISTLSGFWVHAIGLEANTPQASVTGNRIAALAATKSYNANMQEIVDPKNPQDGVGVFFESNAGAATSTVNGNSFTSDLVYGVATASGQVDARHNWWGVASGPKISTNPGGKGSGVSTNVLFDPWCLADGCP